MLSEEGQEILATIRSVLDIPVFLWVPSEYDADVVGPREHGFFEAYLQRRSSAEESAEAELTSMSDLQLFNLYNESRSLEDFKRKHCLTDLPPWYAEGFGFRPVQNYKHWFKMEYWTTEEAVALSIGFDPKAPEIPKSKGLFSPNKSEQFYRERYELVVRAFPPVSEEAPARIAPLDFVAWVIKRSLEVPAAFLSASAVQNIVGYQQPAKVLTSTEKASMLKLIAAMAIAGYKFDPTSTRNEATQDIADDLDRLGIGLDLKTVRKWLKEACSLIDPEILSK